VISLPTAYRVFGSGQALLAAVLDTSFGGDDQPIAFADRPAVLATCDRVRTPPRMISGLDRFSAAPVAAKGHAVGIRPGTW